MGYLIAYTIKSGFGYEERYTDHTIILADATTEQEAIDKYHEIILENDTYVTEVYTACVAKIIDSTEPHHI